MVINITADIYKAIKDKRTALARWIDGDNGRVVVYDGQFWAVERSPYADMGDKAYEQLEDIMATYRGLKKAY